MLLRTQLLYNLPLIIKDMSLLVSNTARSHKQISHALNTGADAVVPSEAGIADCRVSECDRKTRSGTRNRKCSTAVCGQSVTCAVILRHARDFQRIIYKISTVVASLES